MTDPATLERIASLAIPPAWTDVWICPDPCGHVQATGRDQRGRKQARYHTQFRAERDDLKCSQLAAVLAADRRPPTTKGLLVGIDHAASLLGNTRAVCRASYVHPTIQEHYLDGTLPERWRSGPTRASSGLTLAERRTLHVLRSSERASAPAAPPDDTAPVARAA